MPKKARYLVNINSDPKNPRVYIWTERLSERPDMVECDKDGNRIASVATQAPAPAEPAKTTSAFSPDDDRPDLSKMKKSGLLNYAVNGLHLSVSDNLSKAGLIDAIHDEWKRQDAEPAGDEPAGDEPAGDEPAGDEPAGDEPAGDEAQ